MNTLLSFIQKIIPSVYTAPKITFTFEFKNESDDSLLKMIN